MFAVIVRESPRRPWEFEAFTLTRRVGEDSARATQEQERGPQGHARARARCVDERALARFLTGVHRRDTENAEEGT